MSTNGATANAPTGGIDRVVALGYIVAIAIPPFGLILGVVLAIGRGKPSAKHAPWIVALSIVASVVWVLLLTSNALRTASTDY